MNVMNAQSAETRIFALARKMLPGAAKLTITRDMDLLTDLNADSLSLVSLIFAIEEEFGLETSELGSLVTESRTIGDLVAAVESRKVSSG
jgi:acyl carrier protein